MWDRHDWARHRQGTRVVHLPANHDEALRRRIGGSGFSWRRCAEQFLANLRPATPLAAAAE